LSDQGFHSHVASLSTIGSGILYKVFSPNRFVELLYQAIARPVLQKSQAEFRVPLDIVDSPSYAALIDHSLNSGRIHQLNFCEDCSYSECQISERPQFKNSFNATLRSSMAIRRRPTRSPALASQRVMVANQIHPVAFRLQQVDN